MIVAISGAPDSHQFTRQFAVLEEFMNTKTEYEGRLIVCELTWYDATNIQWNTGLAIVMTILIIDTIAIL